MPAVAAPVSRRRAPAVQFPTAVRSVWLATVLGLWSVAGFSVLLAWSWVGASAHPAWFLGAAFVLWLVASGMAWHFWSGLPAGILAWDGEVWTLQCAPEPMLCGTLTVHLDLQRRMAVRLAAADGSCRWIWLEQHRGPSRWGDLRRAVYSRPGQGLVGAPEQASEGVGPV